MGHADGRDLWRGGLSWHKMEKNNRAVLRAQMTSTPGERIESAIRASRLATELAGAPLHQDEASEPEAPTRG